MSRVDEALRRAAELNEDATAGVTTIDTDAEVSAADIDALAQEPFPVEMPGRRSAPREPISVPAAPGPRPAPNRSPAPSRPASFDAKLPSLFERLDGRLAGKTVIHAEVSPSSREQYRRLAGNLHHAQEANGLKVVMITSASVGEGKTLTASNLAMTFSESYHKNVLIVDADLRRPALHAVFGIDNKQSGLSEGLSSPESRKLPVHQVSPRLTVLAAGRPTSNPIAGLTSDRMRRLIEEAREAFDWVIIDTPPVALLPDANLLGSMVDGAVIVVKANGTSYQLVQRAVDAVGKSRVLGVVLNRAQTSATGSEYEDDYYYYYYQPSQQLPPGPGSS